jgi:hypothetical protein
MTQASTSFLKKSSKTLLLNWCPVAPVAQSHKSFFAAFFSNKEGLP